MPSNTVNLDEYLSPGFRPEVVANRLIRETTTSQDTSVDTNSALTRVKYDLDEIDHRMETLCRDNTDALLEHAQRTTSISREVESLRPSVEDVNTTVGKLDRDFVDPFNWATDLHTASNNLYKAASLARALGWYLQLALQAQSEDYRRETTSSAEGAGAAMLRNAYAIKTLTKLVAEVPELRQLKAVDQFDKRIPAIRSSLLDAASGLIRNFNGIGLTQVRQASMTVLALNADLGQIVDAHWRALVGTTVLQLTRTSGVAMDQEKIFGDARDRATIAGMLVAMKTELVSMKNQESSKKAEKLAADETAAFWEAVAMQLDQKLRTMSVTNQGALKTMAANRESILSSAQDVARVHSVLAKYIDK